MKMGKKILLTIAAVLVLLLVAGGCSSGVSNEVFEEQISALTEQVNALVTQLSESEARVASLSNISAYQLWFDQYYSLGTFSFEDVKEFNRSCGQLIREVNDGDIIVSWNLYIEANKAYYDLLDTLSEDTSTWTAAEYDQWLELSQERTDALGQVGATLFTGITR